MIFSPESVDVYHATPDGQSSMYVLGCGDGMEEAWGGQYIAGSAEFRGIAASDCLEWEGCQI